MIYPITIIMTPKKKDVGGGGNCGWLSIAAALIDAHLCSPTNANYEELLGTYRKRNHDDIPAGEQLTFDKLIESVPQEELIENLAIVLKQLAANETEKDPEKYIGAHAERNTTGSLFDPDKGTDPKSIRKKHTWIDETGIAAIARILNVSIKVISKPRPKILDLIHNNKTRRKIPELTYNNEAKNNKNPLIIHYNGWNHYVPEVKTAYFLDSLLQKIWNKICHKETLDQQRERNIQQKLKTFTTTELIALYKKTMQKSDYLPGKIRAITKEYNGNTFFAAAIQDGITKTEREQETKEILINALAKEEYLRPNSEVAKFLNCEQVPSYNQETVTDRQETSTLATNEKTSWCVNAKF